MSNLPEMLRQIADEMDDSREYAMDDISLPPCSEAIVIRDAAIEIEHLVARIDSEWWFAFAFGALTTSVIVWLFHVLFW